MEWWKVLLLAAGILLAGISLRLWAKSKKPVRAALRALLQSEALLLAVHLAGILTGFPVPFSPATAVWTALTGIPGVAALAAAQWLLR